MSKWNLPSDYPTAPAEYVNKKREIAKKTGLGVTTRANRENRAAAAPAATSAKIAKAKPGPKHGKRRKKKETQAEPERNEKAAGHGGDTRQLALLDNKGATEGHADRKTGE